MLDQEACFVEGELGHDGTRLIPILLEGDAGDDELGGEVLLDRHSLVEEEEVLTVDDPLPRHSGGEVALHTVEPADPREHRQGALLVSWGKGGVETVTCLVEEFEGDLLLG